MKTVLIVGGGPAGLAAAIAAARRDARVVVLEKNPRCGVKLLATGGGHCNLGNLQPTSTWPDRFGKRGRFITPALAGLPTERYREWFSELGIDMAAADGFHLYPLSRDARQVRDALVAGASGLGVDIRTECKVERLDFTSSPGSKITGVHSSAGELRGDAVIIACGGMSLPGSGSTGDGYRLAELAGHTVAPPLPALVGLKAEDWDSDLAGLVLPDAAVVFRRKGKTAVTGRRELLLTHVGASGPAILDLSGDVAEALAAGERAELRISWLAAMGRAEWREQWSAWRKTQGTARPETLLAERLPKRLAKWLCARAGFPAAGNVAESKGVHVDRLVELLAEFPLAATATESWDKAIVTRGGVNVKEINPKTLESRLSPGLFFAGEVLDIDGPCGGYNLHWAVASGVLAGTAAAQKA